MYDGQEHYQLPVTSVKNQPILLGKHYLFFVGLEKLVGYNMNLLKFMTLKLWRESELFLHDWVIGQLANTASFFNEENGLKIFLKKIQKNLCGH